jgi:hypothetical protein
MRKTLWELFADCKQLWLAVNAKRLARRGRAGQSTRDLEPVAGFAGDEGSIVA